MEWSRLLCDDRIRSYRKKGSSDLRSEYEKDYHRIIGSASFRRLQDKTQVFPLEKNDFCRTRLTHSLEVSSFSRSLGQSVGRSLVQIVHAPGFLPEYQGDICDILQCAGLLHDIGNPPFGHFGETSIRSWFRENFPRITVQLPGMVEAKPLTEVLNPQMQADFTNFEGNTQALRVVTKLHYLVDEHGMNLTLALLATIIKYPVSSLEIDKNGPVRAHKMGYCYADRDTFDKIETATGTNGDRHPLCYLLEAADDIAYLTADIEDAFKKGILSYDKILYEFEKDCRPEDDPDLPEKEQSDYRRVIETLKYRYQKGIERETDAPDDYAVQNTAVSIQGHFLSAVTKTFIDHYDEIMDGSFDRELIEAGSCAHIAERLGQMADRFVFKSHPIVTIEISMNRILTFLLDNFVPAVLYYDTGLPMTPVDTRLVSIISENYRMIYHIYSKGKDEAERLYLRLLLVTDFICGMTDSYAQDLYWKLNGRI